MAIGKVISIHFLNTTHALQPFLKRTIMNCNHGDILKQQQRHIEEMFTVKQAQTPDSARITMKVMCIQCSILQKFVFKDNAGSYLRLCFPENCALAC